MSGWLNIIQKKKECPWPGCDNYVHWEYDADGICIHLCEEHLKRVMDELKTAGKETKP